MLEKKGIRVAHIARTLSVSEMTVFNTLDRIRHNLKIQEHIAETLNEDAFELWGIDYRPVYQRNREKVYPTKFHRKQEKTTVQTEMQDRGIMQTQVAQSLGVSDNAVCLAVRCKSHNKKIQDHIASLLDAEPEQLWGDHYADKWLAMKKSLQNNKMKPCSKLNAHIKAALWTRGITSKSIADELGLSRERVSQVVRGCNRNERIQNKIAEILGKDPARLWGTTYAPFCKKQLQAIRNHQPLSMIG